MISLPWFFFIYLGFINSLYLLYIESLRQPYSYPGSVMPGEIFFRVADPDSDLLYFHGRIRLTAGSGSLQ